MTEKQPEKFEENSEPERVSQELREMVKNLESQQNNTEGFIRESLGKRIQGIVNESRLPSSEYKSTVGVYGGKIKIEDDGKMVWSRKGLISKVDKAGDAVLRSYDEHVVKEPAKLLRRHPKIAMKKFFNPGTKRYRGDNKEILENINKLGLSEYYGPHENGIEIKKTELYTEGIALQDVYRSDIIGSEKLNEADRFQALSKASQYVRTIHDDHGGIGELVVGDIIFQKDEHGKLENPVLNLPDIVFNKEKNITEDEKKATDILDFLASIASEEMRRSQNVDEISRALNTVISSYGDVKTISLVRSFVKRGRLTLQGDLELLNLPESLTKKARGIFAQHNKARLGSTKNIEGLIKEKILEACDTFLTDNKNK